MARQLQTDPPLIPVPFAQNGSKSTIAETPSNIGDPNATWDQGFPAITMQSKNAGGKPPLGLDFQGIFYVLSNHIYWLQTGSLYKWDKDYNYLSGAHILGSDGKEYKAIAPSGPSIPAVSGYVGAKDPTSEPQYWREADVAPLAEACSGNSATSTKLLNPRNLRVADNSLTNYGPSESFDGSRDATLKLPNIIKADLDGNANTATRATYDKNGKDIAATYVTKDKLAADLSASITNNIVTVSSSTTKIYVDSSDLKSDDKNIGTENSPLRTLKEALIKSKLHRGTVEIHVWAMADAVGAFTINDVCCSIIFESQVKFNPCITFSNSRVYITAQDDIDGSANGGLKFYNSYATINGGNSKINLFETFICTRNSYVSIGTDVTLTTKSYITTSYNSTLYISTGADVTCLYCDITRQGGYVQAVNSKLTTTGVGSNGKFRVASASCAIVIGGEIYCGFMQVTANSYMYANQGVDGTDYSISYIEITCTKESTYHPRYAALEIRMSSFFIDGASQLEIKMTNKHIIGSKAVDYTYYAIWCRQNGFFLAEGTETEDDNVSITIIISGYFKNYIYVCHTNSAMVFSADNTYGTDTGIKSGAPYHVSGNSIIDTNGNAGDLQGIGSGVVSTKGSNLCV